MLTPNDGGARGRKAGHLRRPEWSRCNPPLLEFLRRRREGRRPHIAEAEMESGADGKFPNFEFYSRPFCGRRRREHFAAGRSLALTQFPRRSAPEENLAAMDDKRAKLARRLGAEVRQAHFCDHPRLFFLAAVQPRHADAFCGAADRLRRGWREPKPRAKVYAPDDIRETVREPHAARRARGARP